MKELSRRQKGILCSMAARAYKMCGQEQGYNNVDEYRHAVVGNICGKGGLRECEQRDYVPLYNYFCVVLGIRRMGDGGTVVSAEGALEWTLRDRMSFWGIEEAYVAAIARDNYGVSGRTLDSILPYLECQEIRRLIWIVCARGRRRAARESAELGIEAPVEVHRSRATMPPKRLAEARGDVMMVVGRRR